MRYDLKAIKARNNIIEVARELGCSVQHNAMRCFHPECHRNQDAHPSLSLDTKKNSFCCPVCNDVRGDVIDFVRQKTKLSFYNAVKYLADRIGLMPVSKNEDDSTSGEIPQAKPSTAERDHDTLLESVKGSALGEPSSKSRPRHKFEESADKTEFSDVNECFLDLCSPPTREALDYLEARGISQTTAEVHGVRYVSNQRAVYETLVSKFCMEKLRASGILNKNDRLFCQAHPLVWVFFQGGKPVYFQGRSLDSNRRPKEMCLSRGRPPLYNTDIFKRNPGKVYICEGVIDTMTLTENYFAAVGVVGVQGFRDEFLPLFSGRRVKVAFDSDLPGQSAGQMLVQVLRSRGIEAEKVYLPDGYDVNSYFRALKQFTS